MFYGVAVTETSTEISGGGATGRLTSVLNCASFTWEGWINLRVDIIPMNMNKIMMILKHLTLTC